MHRSIDEAGCKHYCKTVESHILLFAIQQLQVHQELSGFNWKFPRQKMSLILNASWNPVVRSHCLVPY